MSYFPGELIRYLRAAERVVALTGAGVSAESGIPTFRQAQTGLWAIYNPQDLASVEAYNRDPKLVWEWYEWRRGLVAAAQPNPAHLALAQMEQHVPGFTLITQNIDGLHQRAGSGRRGALIELHGNLFRAKCFDEERVVESWPESAEVPPRCPRCGGLLRPDVVWFGERLPAQALQDAIHATESAQAFLSIGTSGVVEPAASLPFLAQRRKAVVVEINMERTPLTTAADFAFNASAGTVLPELVEAVWGVA